MPSNKITKIFPIGGLKWRKAENVGLLDGFIVNATRGRSATQRSLIADGQYLVSANEFIQKIIDELLLQGISGPTGPTGPLGPTGPTGAQGPIGLTGSDSTVPGPDGPIGPDGDTGPTGLLGPIGPTGAAGVGLNFKGTDTLANILAKTATLVGDAWVTTTASPPNDGLGNPVAIDDVLVAQDLLVPSTWTTIGPVQGPTGDTGPQGIQGIQGDPGLDGTNGAIGPTGPQGLTGADSIVPGPQGIQGLIGPAGPTGADSIVAGPAGALGPTGPQGLLGPDGPIGPTGADSVVPGPAGDTGLQGVPGADSVVPGPAGPMGDAGAPGADGAVGGIGPIGPTGPQGLPGADGAGGAVGPAGPAGMNNMVWNGSADAAGTNFPRYSRTDDNYAFVKTGVGAYMFYKGSNPQPNLTIIGSVSNTAQGNFTFDFTTQTVNLYSGGVQADMAFNAVVFVLE